MKPRDDLLRIMIKVDKTESCWLFMGAKVSGYGSVRFKKKSYLAHRAVWELMIGTIPEGKELCHKCDVRNCVNPEHIFIGTRSENMKDCANKGKSNFQKTPHNKTKKECPSGHAYSDENTFIDEFGWRKCRTCSRIRRMKRYYAIKSGT